MSNPTTRWHYRDPLLVWLLVAAYGLHVVEEYVGGFPEWFALVATRPLGRPDFLVINAVAMVAMVAAASAAVRHESRGWIPIGIATLLLVNGLAHILGSLVTGTYSPGLFTSVVLYLPLGQLVLLRAWHQAPEAHCWAGAAAGIMAQVVVAILALSLANR